jgi:diguanylate cyclase (GGDEF)-like protein
MASPKSKALAYATLGAVLSQGAPIGAALLQSFVDGQSPFADVADQPLLYAYMSLATGLAFSIFGYALGRSADHLLDQRRALRHANHRLKWLSEIDSLTGVLNRWSVRARLLAEMKRAEREDRPVALLMLDLDHFKRINDTFGHTAGDRVLRRVGRHLRRLARATDSVGRIGGEEFLVVLPATGAVEAQAFAERLRIAIGANPRNSAVPPVTVSVGVLVLRGPDPNAIDEALAEVDGALYRAKAEGRNRVSIAPDPDAPVVRGEFAARRAGREPVPR